MPTSPAANEAVAVELLRVYSEAEVIMLERIAKRLEKGLEAPEWAEEKLAELRVLREEAAREVERLSREGVQLTRRAIEQAYRSGSTDAVRDLAKVMQPREIRSGFTAANRRAVENIVREAVTNLQATHFRILRQTEDIYRSVVAEASSRAATGAMTRRQAAQMMLNLWADRGITGFVDRAGRSWELASYAEMAARTASGRAAVQGHIDRLTENGYDLVIVSDSPDECELCRPWEGRILSVTGRDPNYPSLSTAQSAGLFHPRCTHSLGAYIPGLTRPMTDTADPEGFEERQRQREIERQIRRWKRREVVALDEDARMKARSKVREWQAVMRQFIDETGRIRQRQREQITRAF